MKHLEDIMNANMKTVAKSQRRPRGRCGSGRPCQAHPLSYTRGRRTLLDLTHSDDEPDEIIIVEEGRPIRRERNNFPLDSIHSIIPEGLSKNHSPSRLEYSDDNVIIVPEEPCRRRPDCVEQNNLSSDEAPSTSSKRLYRPTCNTCACGHPVTPPSTIAASGLQEDEPSPDIGELNKDYANSKDITSWINNEEIDEVKKQLKRLESKLSKHYQAALSERQDDRKLLGFTRAVEQRQRTVKEEEINIGTALALLRKILVQMGDGPGLSGTSLDAGSDFWESVAHGADSVCESGAHGNDNVSATKPDSAERDNLPAKSKGSRASESKEKEKDDLDILIDECLCIDSEIKTNESPLSPLIKHHRTDYQPRPETPEPVTYVQEPVTAIELNDQSPPSPAQSAKAKTFEGPFFYDGYDGYDPVFSYNAGFSISRNATLRGLIDKAERRGDHERACTLRAAVDALGFQDKDRRACVAPTDYHHLPPPTPAQHADRTPPFPLGRKPYSAKKKHSSRLNFTGKSSPPPPLSINSFNSTPILKEIYPALVCKPPALPTSTTILTHLQNFYTCLKASGLEAYFVFHQTNAITFPPPGHIEWCTPPEAEAEINLDFGSHHQAAAAAGEEAGQTIVHLALDLVERLQKDCGLEVGFQIQREGRIGAGGVTAGKVEWGSYQESGSDCRDCHEAREEGSRESFVNRRVRGKEYS